jgi:DNA-binding LytR/AlgR family response regulator
VDTAQVIQREYSLPIIYLTANTDDEHFNRAKSTNPSAFISKPFKKLDLQHAIELTIDRMSKNGDKKSQDALCESPYVQSESIFVRKNERMIKIMIDDIFYFEADRNYCKVHAKNRECLLVMTLKEIDEKLPNEHFLRIHRSYIVNLSHVDEVAGSHVVIGKKAIPMSKNLRNELLNRLQTF